MASLAVVDFDDSGDGEELKEAIMEERLLLFFKGR